MSETWEAGYTEIAEALRTAHNTIGKVTWPYGGSIFQAAVLTQLRQMFDEAIDKIRDSRGENGDELPQEASERHE